MSTRLLLLWRVALFVIAGFGSGGAADAAIPELPGRYSDGGNPPTYIDLRADGTFSLTQGPNSMAGTYTAQGNNLTVMMAGRPPAPFQFANGILIAPDGMQLRRTGEPAAAAAVAQSAANARAAGAVDPRALAQSINHVKQLCIACKLWAADHQGAFPDTVAQVMNPEYLGKNPNYAIVHCPLLHDDSQAGYVYLGKGQTESAPGGAVLFLSRWQDAAGHRVVGHANAAVALEFPRLDDLPAALRARATPPANPAIPGGTPARAPMVAGPSQIWRPWHASVEPSHPTGDSFPLTFTNLKSMPVKIYWLGGKGGTFYSEIPPGGTYNQKVRKGAVWYATNSADVPLGYFVIGEEGDQAIIPAR